MTNLNERDPAALEQENPDESGNDYKLVNGRSCWISMGAFSVYAKLTDEGIVVDIYPYKAEFEALASTYAFNSDAEAAYCESEGIDFDEAQAWAVEQGAGNWDEQEPATRMEWLRRFAPSEKPGDSAMPKTNGAPVSNCGAMLYAVYSPNESAINSGASFWSNQEGWTDQEHATSFSLDEARTLNLPLSVGQDAQSCRYLLVKTRNGCRFLISHFLHNQPRKIMSDCNTQDGQTQAGARKNCGGCPNATPPR